MPLAPGSMSLTESQPKLAVSTGSKHHSPIVLSIFMDSPELVAGEHKEIRSPHRRQMRTHQPIQHIAEYKMRKEACKYHTKEAGPCCKDGLAVVQALALPLASRSANLPPNWSLFARSSSPSWLPAKPLLIQLSSLHRTGEQCQAGAGTSI